MNFKQICLVSDETLALANASRSTKICYEFSGNFKEICLVLDETRAQMGLLALANASQSMEKLRKNLRKSACFR